MDVELELIEKHQLLEDLMALTGNNLGLSHQLLSKVIKKTEQEVQPASSKADQANLLIKLNNRVGMAIFRS